MSRQDNGPQTPFLPRGGQGTLFELNKYHPSFMKWFVATLLIAQSENGQGVRSNLAR